MEPLFSSTFPPSTKLDWITQVQKEAKNADAHERMRWQTDKAFTLEPYYTVDDLNQLPLASIQDAQKQVPGWLNAPEYLISSEKADNVALRDALTRGADALVLTLATKPDLSLLLNGIKLSETPVFFRFNTRQQSINIVDFVQALKTIAPYQLKGGLLTDANDYTADVTRQTADSPLFRTICISSHAFHNAGATATQELAFTLAMLADAYDSLTDDGLLIDQLVAKTMLSVSIGTSYFMEIAKLRALRVLSRRFVSAFHSSPVSPLFQIHAQTSTFYDAVASPYTNLLRSTTEAMTSVMGGCDALTIHPYNAVSGRMPDRAFGERIARNISVLLREESHLDKVADPSAGSYYVETLTHELVESTWALFLAVEKQGGYKAALNDGFIQREIDRSYQAKVEAVKKGKVLVGVTKYRSDDGINKPEETTQNDAGILPNRRLAEEFD
ncbi:methylmalonyl-CoA mutase family protein [Spirosoma spitsbergense]|uniref:methylmalonyl-CoA mutase family protein n=1 Tax=Spirosoma spitsbergense TaxID=431554 RepID=UPI00037DD252|nr:methylmalonyl-CoA mutase family protein [Spirosoma spitsbergense]